MAHFEWYLLASCCVPLIVEVLVGGEVETPIPWNVVVLATACMLFRKEEALKHAGLVVLITYSWMRFFMHLQPGVACMIPSDAEDWLEACRRGGLVRHCTASIETLNRLKRQQDNCPGTVFGSTLGPVYNVLAYVFRVLPCCVVAPLYLWRRKRREEKHDLHHSLFALSVAVATCSIMEIAVVNVRRLSSLEVVLPFLFALQVDRLFLKKRLLELGMFYAIADFFMRGTSTVYKCVGTGISQKELLELCRSENQRDCLRGINRLGSLEEEDCPRVDFASVLMCFSAVLKVALLTVGVVFVTGVLEPGDDFPSSLPKEEEVEEKESVSEGASATALPDTSTLTKKKTFSSSLSKH